MNQIRITRNSLFIIRGFSLVELLVSLGIITTLTSISLTVINPVELMRQARDTKRIEEFGSLHSALLLTWGEFPETPLGTTQTVYLSLPDSSSTCGSYAGLIPSLPNGWSYKCVSASNLRNVNGTGWIPVDFTTVSTSLKTAPLTTLPIDPVNTHLSYYRFVVSSENKYELDTPLESTKIDLDQKDGGSDDTLYEVGSSLSIYPIAGYLATDVINDTGQTIFAAGSANQVAYFLNATTIIGNNALYWNPTSGYLGINTAGAPTSALDVVGNVNFTGTLQSGSVPWARLTSFPSACTSGQYVTAVGTTLTCGTPASGGIGGSGTANYLTKWSAATTTTNSLIYDNGTSIGIGTASPSYPLHLYTTGTGDEFIQLETSGAGAPGKSYFGQTRRGYSNLTVIGNGTYSEGSAHLAISSSGNVGIGTTTPASKLGVAGVIESGSGGFKFPDGTTQTTAASGGSTPSGAVMFFNLASCPSGWTDKTALWGGRYLVAKTTNATLAQTVGTALGDAATMENRTVGQHSHGITDPGHTHSFTVMKESRDNGQGGTPFDTGVNDVWTCCNVTYYTNSNTTGVTINNAGSVAGTNAPYVQLLACQKD